MEKKLLFALDIGTRSVVGLVGEQTDTTIELLAVERLEHHTRAMLDGQIHDVPEVASIIAAVKSRLEESCGPLQKVSVAAAGRALCTIKANAEIDSSSRGVLSANDEQSLELSAIQNAQHQLATSNTIADPTSYYCVGYSVIGFTLDGTPLKSLVGQRGKTAATDVIATFLPRQVIDSLQSALNTVGLEMATLTLEPIAAINVLIPQTMRHLNLTLVDVGAGTSDVAITRDGSVIGYGMVPCAGDEITEAISQKYLLDFNVAEMLKRQLGGKNRKIEYTDVLGTSHKITPKEVLAAISPNVAELAQAIAAQILALNNTAPQAVLLVGGGSLTPLLPEALAQALDVPASRVAIRRPEAVEGLCNLPASLSTPDAVTPLGILKLSNSRALNFINITLNDQPLRIFNLGNLTVADALLVAGIDIRTLHGRPGLALTITLNGQTKFIPGSHGTPGLIELNGASAKFNDHLNENDVLAVTKGRNGITPSPLLRDVIEIPPPLPVTINGKPFAVPPVLTVNGHPSAPDTKLADRDQVICHQLETLDEILTATNNLADAADYVYTINGQQRLYTVRSTFTVRRDGTEFAAEPSMPVRPHDAINVTPHSEPTLGELLGLTEPRNNFVTIQFNGAKCNVPLRRYSLTMNGKAAYPADIAASESVIEFSCHEQSEIIISDVLLAADFNTSLLPPNSTVDIRLNGQSAEYISPVKNGDIVETIITTR